MKYIYVTVTFVSPLKGQLSWRTSGGYFHLFLQDRRGFPNTSESVTYYRNCFVPDQICILLLDANRIFSRSS